MLLESGRHSSSQAAAKIDKLLCVEELHTRVAGQACTKWTLCRFTLMQGEHRMTSQSFLMMACVMLCSVPVPPTSGVSTDLSPSSYTCVCVRRGRQAATAPASPVC